MQDQSTAVLWPLEGRWTAEQFLGAECGEGRGALRAEAVGMAREGAGAAWDCGPSESRGAVLGSVLEATVLEEGRVEAEVVGGLSPAVEGPAGSPSEQQEWECLGGGHVNTTVWGVVDGTVLGVGARQSRSAPPSGVSKC